VLAFDLISGTGIVKEAYVVGTPTTTLVQSVAATSTPGAQTLTFTRQSYVLPSDFNQVYDVRLLNNPRPLVYTPQRSYDMLRPGNESATPYVYTLFMWGNDGYIKIMPPPSALAQASLRYYRRMTQPVNGSDVLDIPQRYEIYILAMAKAQFLADKGGQAERMMYWSQIADQGLQRAQANAMQIPDDRPAFEPDYVQRGWGMNLNDVRPYVD
jgi:hypothetical protein